MGEEQGNRMTEFNYGVVRSAEEFENFVDRLIEADKPFGFDIESGFTPPVTEEKVALKFRHPQWLIAGFSFTNSDEWARYVPLNHDNGDNVDDPVRVAQALWRLLQTGNGVAHNAAFELGALARWFREILSFEDEVSDARGFYPILSDSMIEAYLVAKYHPTQVGQGLKGLVLHIFGHKMIEFNDLFTDLLASKALKSKKDVRFNMLELTPMVIEYACEDALWCLKLHYKHIRMLEKMQVYKTVYRAEIALLSVVADMEYEGMLLNWDTITSKANEVEEIVTIMNEEIQGELSELLGETININLGSPAQVAEVLFNKMGIEHNPRHVSDTTGAPSTSEKALGSITGQHPIVKRILEYRNAKKLLTSYLRKYETQLNYAGDGRAYPNHKQTGTTTGRFSVDGVSYQQWPKPYHYELKSGRIFDLNFRDLMIAPEGTRIIGFDFSQVELRVLAGAAQETAMIEAFNNGTDIHTATASTMLGIPVDEITPKDRQLGKTLNFAIVYGSGADGIADLIGCTKDEAQVHLKNYFKAFPGIKKFMDEQVNMGRTKGYIENLFGRRVKIWEFLDNRKWMVAKGERFAGNAPIQGGAGDYLKVGMVRAHQAIAKAGLGDKIKMIVTFHDALEFYVDESVTTQEFIDIVGPAVSFPIPDYPDIKADWHEGFQWGTLAEIELEDGKVSEYKISATLPDRTSHSWSGVTLEEALTPYYHWARSHYGDSYKDLDYYLSRVPEAAGYEPIHSEEPFTENESPEKLNGASREEHDSQSVVITLSAMPSRERWDNFREWLETRPGSVELTVVTPEGSITLDETYRILPGDRGKINLLLSGATLAFPTSEYVDVMEGIDI